MNYTLFYYKILFNKTKMAIVESKIRRWGNSSLALVIPKKIAEKEH